MLSTDIIFSLQFGRILQKQVQKYRQTKLMLYTKSCILLHRLMKPGKYYILEISSKRSMTVFRRRLLFLILNQLQMFPKSYVRIAAGNLLCVSRRKEAVKGKGFWAVPIIQSAHTKKTCQMNMKSRVKRYILRNADIWSA